MKSIINNKRKDLNQRGITLIALVITIVVLLILAGVSINAVFSDNGIIKRAQEAQNKMDEAQQKDLNSINELSNWLDGQTDSTTTATEINFKLNGKSYTARENMTWNEWIDSEYNTDGWTKFDDNVLLNADRTMALDTMGADGVNSIIKANSNYILAPF